MYDHIRGDVLFIMLYAAVTALAFVASIYLLLRRGNAFAADITPPLRLRRWAAVFFAALALNHVWYMPIFFLSSSEAIKMTDLIGGLLDCMTLFPLAIILLLTMLQDRRRPLWPVALMMAPIIAGSAFSVATRSYALLPAVYVYFLLMCIGLIINMVHALRQYDRWLCDNYADLEHKEVWQSFVVLAMVLLMFSIYAFTSEGPFYQYAMQLILVVFICYFLWRVETLSDLSIPVNEEEEAQENRMEALITRTMDQAASPHDAPHDPPLTFRNNIGPLLKKYCEEPQRYLQHDISVTQLARQVGINRSYLSKHFASQGITYNAYINGLRIQHFINLYHESAAAHQPVTAQQLAYQSGFRSYNTFSVAFKRIMGMTATEWMRHIEEQQQGIVDDS